MNARARATAVADIHYVDDGAGWRLALKHVRALGGPGNTRSERPVLIVPGYQMNSSVFGYHPNGASLEEHLASRGIDVWSVDLRGQGRAVRTYGSDTFGMEELAIEDLAAAIAYVRGVTRARAVDILGCSLGTALAFAYLACVPEARESVGCIVAMGGVVTWGHVNRALRLVARAPWLVGQLRMRGTRRLARAALPVVARVAPKLLSVYLNVESTDTSNPDEMVQTVEDPNPVMNREIAKWIVRRELIVRGVNVSRELPRMKLPFLCVIGLQDGIVPPATSRVLYEAIGSTDKALLEVGDESLPIAHADLFLARGAQQLVFEPIARWLVERPRITVAAVGSS
ncbi:MAG: alpha/beta fold hydrolase [Polyangiaceae bacterium]